METTVQPQGSFRVQLPVFEGPLDLLLHLIQKHEIDIFDIPIAFITEEYLRHLDLMNALDLDVAGEFLVMAATLAHIKSRLLLPRPEPDPEGEPEEDPREALVRRLLEYQKYKAVAADLGKRDLLDRDVFARRAPPPKVVPAEGDLGLAEVSVFKLVEALDRALKAARVVIPHEVLAERISVADRIAEIAERLREAPELSFFQILLDVPDRGRIVATFLAVLEMARLRLLKLRQDAGSGDILITGTGQGEPESRLEVVDDYE